MLYHVLDSGDTGYCACGRWVRAVVIGFGPQTRFIYVDDDNSEECQS